MMNIIITDLLRVPIECGGGLRLCERGIIVTELLRISSVGAVSDVANEGVYRATPAAASAVMIPSQGILSICQVSLLIIGIITILA